MKEPQACAALTKLGRTVFLFSDNGAPLVSKQVREGHRGIVRPFAAVTFKLQSFFVQLAFELSSFQAFKLSSFQASSSWNFLLSDTQYPRCVAGMDHDNDDNDNEVRKKPKQAQSVLEEATIDGLYWIIEYEIQNLETGAQG